MTTRITGNLDTVLCAARVQEPSDLLKLVRNSVNREHGPYRRPVGGARSTVPAAAAVRWAWAILARSAESLSTLIRPVIAAFSTGSVLGCYCACCKNLPRIYATVLHFF